MLSESYCSCTAGKGICNHKIALLYTVAHFKSAGFKVVPPVVTKTSLSQKWHIPSRTRGIRAEAVKSIKFQSPVEKSRKRKWSQVKDRKQIECVKPKIYNPVREELCNVPSQFATSLRSSLLLFEDKLQIFKILPSSYDELPKVDTEYGQVYKGSTLANQNLPNGPRSILANANEKLCPDFNFPQLECQFVNVLSHDETETYETFVVTPELCREYEKLTRGQSASEDWRQLRKFRLTSSKNFKQVASRKRDFERLTQSMLNEKVVQTAAMKYGLEHENEAAKAYVDATGNNVYLSGIVINPSAPYLACSPDGRVFDNSENGPEQFGLLEIKCPQATSFIEMPYLVEQDNKFYLKPVHMYFYQIQGQMGLTGAKWRDFMVYCDNDYHIERIYFDTNFFDNMKWKLDTFYFTYFLPEVIRIKTTL